MFSNSFFLDHISSPTDQALTGSTLSDFIQLKLLLLNTVNKHSANNLTPEEAKDIIDAVLPLSKHSDPKVDWILAELLLLSLDSGNNVLSESQLKEILKGFQNLAKPTDSKSSKPPENRSIASALTKLIVQQPSVAPEIFSTLGLQALTNLSKSKKDDRLFFLSFSKILAELVKNDGEHLVEEGLIQFLANAISNEKKHNLVKKKTATLLPSFIEEQDLIQFDAREETLKEVARCLGNLALYSPNCVPQALEQRALDVLQQISISTTNQEILRFTARAISNISGIERCRPMLIEEGWVAQLQHWILSECHYNVTRVTKTLGSVEKDRQSSQHSQSHPVEQDENKLLSAISLVGLGNLAISDLKAASDITRTLLIRELLEGIKRGDNENLRSQTARLISIIASHEDSFLTKRLLTLVGTDGLVLLNQHADSTTKYFIARSIASLGKDRIIASDFVQGRGATNPGWKMMENLLEADSIPIQQQLARAIANFSITMGSNKVAKLGVQHHLEKWVKSKDPVLVENAVRALATLESRNITGAKYVDGIHLLHPRDMSEQILSETDRDFDLVFIHGVQGDPLGTWRSLNENENGVLNRI